VEPADRATDGRVGRLSDGASPDRPPDPPGRPPGSPGARDPRRTEGPVLPPLPSAAVTDEERFAHQLKIAALIAGTFMVLAAIGAILATSVFR